MARIARLVNSGEATVYHVTSRTALEGFPLGEVEKDYLLGLLKRLSRFYLTEVLGFAIMGNHFHLLVRMLPETNFSDEDLFSRVEGFYGNKQTVMASDLLKYRKKLGSLSELMKDLKR